MRRRHTREEYLDLVARIREAIPDVDAIDRYDCWLPGRDAREDFEQTLSLVEAVQYHSMFSFKYSARPNTLASKRMPDDVSEAEKTARIVALQALQRDIQTRLHERGGRDARSRCWWTRRAGGATARSRAGRAGNTVVNFPVPAGDAEPARTVDRPHGAGDDHGGRDRTASGASCGDAAGIDPA